MISSLVRTRVRHRPVPLFILLGLFAITGCAAPYQIVNDGKNHQAGFEKDGAYWNGGDRPNIVDHVIIVDGQGVPHDPLQSTPDGPPLGMDAFRDQIAHMFKAMDKFHSARGDLKILIFVHGGLNDPDNSLDQADREIQPIMDAGYYPIFLNWDSGFADTYGEHLGRITQGISDDTLVRRALMPFYFIGDVGRGITRAPVVWSNQVGNDLSAFAADMAALGNGNASAQAQRIANPATVSVAQADSERWADQRRGDGVLNAFKKLRQARDDEKQKLAPFHDKDHPRKEIEIIIGPDLDVSSARMAGRGVSYVLTSPTKFGLSWVIDALATPAWQNMMRRTLMAFDGQYGGNPVNPVNQQPEFNHAAAAMPETAPVEADRPPSNHPRNFSQTGAVEVFREELLKALSRSHPSTEPTTQPAGDSPRKYEITLIAHSAGTLILNEWLRRDILQEQHQLYKNIVYMGAACSVRDFLRAVVPYLLQHNQTQFYNLMLHPLADRRETGETGDIVPRGSLPMWLDEFLTDPQTPLDRTLGRWDNIVPATGFIPDNVRGQITLKAFPLAPYDTYPPPPGMPDYGPQVHGQFRGRPYWLRNFWKSESPILAPAK